MAFATRLLELRPGAGYGKEYSRKAATKIRRTHAVKQAIETEQAQLRQKAKYDVEQAVVEIDRAIAFGYQKSNPMSVAKLLELKMRLYGLWIERFQEVPIDLKGALEEARHRVIDITPHQRLDSASAVLTEPQSPVGDQAVRIEVNGSPKWTPLMD
jgi:hypothetical protein